MSNLGTVARMLLTIHLIALVNLGKRIGKDQLVVQIESMVIAPDAPVPGNDLKITVTGSSKEAIEVRCERLHNLDYSAADTVLRKAQPLT